jgi:hypothetical protein
MTTLVPSVFVLFVLLFADYWPSLVPRGASQRGTVGYGKFSTRRNQAELHGAWNRGFSIGIDVAVLLPFWQLETKKTTARASTQRDLFYSFGSGLPGIKPEQLKLHPKERSGARFGRRFLLMRKLLVIFSSLALSSALVFAQVSAPVESVQPQSTARPGQVSSMSYGAAQSIGELEQLAQNTATDLGRVRVDKWKTDEPYKDQAGANAESLQRNLTAAVPTLIQQLRTNPSSLAANVKLYRNLNAVYDVLSSFTESAGAFGSKDDYNALARDTASLDNIRRTLADQLEQMASVQDAQVARLTAQVRSQQAAAVAALPKRVIVDDNTPAKKKTAPSKKKATAKTTSPQ